MVIMFPFHSTTLAPMRWVIPQFTLGDIGLANGILERGFTMIHMPEKGDDGRPRCGPFRCASAVESGSWWQPWPGRDSNGVPDKYQPMPEADLLPHVDVHHLIDGGEDIHGHQLAD